MDEEALISALRLLAEHSTQCRALRERGLARARDFSWRKVARRVCDALPGPIGYVEGAKCVSL
jgi:glycosyltransferase involved in cell wall biosynthesis